MEKIDNFSGEYHFLSNFALCDIGYEDYIYKSLEHAYQAAKTLNEAERLKIRLSVTPCQAKKAGMHVTLRSDWKVIRVPIMELLLRRKFSQPKFFELLQATENAELIEGNWWNDKFWGVCNGEGKNMLGKLLMKIRKYPMFVE